MGTNGRDIVQSFQFYSNVGRLGPSRHPFSRSSGVSRLRSWTRGEGPPHISTVRGDLTNERKVAGHCQVERLGRLEFERVFKGTILDKETADQDPTTGFIPTYSR